jgi:hypothetical protein
MGLGLDETGNINYPPPESNPNFYIILMYSTPEETCGGFYGVDLRKNQRCSAIKWG